MRYKEWRNQLNLKMNKTEELLKQWARARKSAERARNEAARCEEERIKAENQLGCWLCADDGKMGETFNVWIGSGILEASKISNDENPSYQVRWRKEPDGKDRHEMEW